jgi:hypothetical protein
MRGAVFSSFFAPDYNACRYSLFILIPGCRKILYSNAIEVFSKQFATEIAYKFEKKTQISLRWLEKKGKDIVQFKL